MDSAYTRYVGHIDVCLFTRTHSIPLRGYTCVQLLAFCLVSHTLLALSVSEDDAGSRKDARTRVTPIASILSRLRWDASVEDSDEYMAVVSAKGADTEGVFSVSVVHLCECE